MYLSKKAPKNRIKEAENARKNRKEIVEALSQGQITKRDLFKWGLLTSAGVIAAKHGLSPFAPSAYGSDIPTGTPRSPTEGVRPFTTELPRLNLQQPYDLTQKVRNNVNEIDAKWPSEAKTPNARRLSWHTNFNNSGGTKFINPKLKYGPREGRPWGEYFAHQRWEEFFPQKGYVMTIGRCATGTTFHPDLPAQDPNAVWTFNSGKFTRGVLPPPLIKARYGEPVIARIYNNLPKNRAKNGGFGRNEFAIHNHNAHNASASDGASNAHYFPGQFYDYHWSTCLARHDMTNTAATDPRASGPTDDGGLNYVPGDFRELQSSLWFHDHRFYFTAENVYKGMLGMLNYYSGPDRGNEEHMDSDGVNLQLPSGTALSWGNIDFDVNLVISDGALDQEGQLFFDIFDTDGFLGDLMFVNFHYKPYMEVLPRKYRLRLLNGSMSRFIQLTLVTSNGTPVPFDVIANDGNFLVNTVREQTLLDEQATAERFDIIVDFSRVDPSEEIYLVNRLEHKDGRRPEGLVSIAQAFNGIDDDPAVGPLMKFVLVNQLQSVDDPTVTNYATTPDNSKVPDVLTEQIPIVEPVRERVIEWKRGSPATECFPDCGEREADALLEGFDWSVRVNGESTHSLNANRVSSVIPKPGEVEHWTMVNGGGGWDHPIHLHFEEGVTMSRGDDGPMPATERLARKDVWRLKRGGVVKFQVRFGEFGGAYVNHCHNTVHEDNAMLMRYDVLTEEGGPESQVHTTIIPTPNPQPEGVTYLDPEILPEGDPRDPEYFESDHDEFADLGPEEG